MNREARLGLVFQALTDPTRRAILAQLERDGTASVSALAQPFAIQLPAVMKHLEVLRRAGLVRRKKHGRTVSVQLEPAPLREAVDWFARYERFWSPRLDRLARYAEAHESQLTEKTVKP